MAYIGKSIESGTFSVLDTSGNTYNGSNTTFSLGTQVGSPAQLLVSHDGVIQKPGTDYSLASGGTQITFSTAPASGASIFITEISGAVGGPLDSDLNGSELILDADGDTSITADTDDQIDIKVAGTDQITIKDGALSPVTDNDIDLGTSSLEFKDAFFDGTVTTDGLTVSGTPSFADGSIAIADLDIDGGTDIGEAIVDADLFIIDNGAGGTNRKTAASRLKTYIGSGGLQYLSKHTASDGDSYLTLDGVFSSTYDNYLLIGTLWQNNTDNNHLRIQFKTDAFSADSIYDSQVMGINGGSVGGTINQNNNAYGTMGGLGNQGSASNELSNFQLTIYQPADQSTHQFWQTHTSGKMYNGNYIAGSGGGVWEDLTAVTGIRFYYGSGTIKSGEVLLYGIKSS